MKKTVDFIIRYEHKVRELESIMLLKLELERRGYTVRLICNYDYKDVNNYNPKVLVVPAIYSDGQLYGDWYNYGLIHKIANLQWEQLIGIKEEEDINGYHNINGIGTQVITFCWGKKSYDRLVNSGLENNKAKVVGQINTDLLRGEFKQLLYTKDILSAKYGIDGKKRWYLFISSFAYCEMDEQQAKMSEAQLGKEDFDAFKDASYKSRDAILDWFEKKLVSCPETLIIYRPHPDETQKCERLKSMAQNYDNFKMVSQEAIKHWVNACDKVYNWFSTGIIDAVVLNKPIRMLRPIEIKEDLDYRLMHNSRQLKNEEDFENDFNNLEIEEVFESELLKSYYFLPENYVYKEICDKLEELLHTTQYDINYKWNDRIKLSYIIVRRRIFNAIMPKLHFIPESIWPNFIRKRIQMHRELLNTRIHGFEKNVASELEIEEQSQRLRAFIHG